MVQAHAHELLNQKNAHQADHPLITARDRLMAAFTRLESRLQQVGALAEREVKQHERLVAFERENEALRKERETLSATISDLETQYDALHKAAGKIYNKLDDSIKRLTQIIEG